MLFDERASYSPLPQPPKRGDSKYAALTGQVITISEAAAEFEIPRKNFMNWVQKGYIKVLAPGTPGVAMDLDKADVSFCADVYHWRKGLGFSSGAPLLDELGEAYQLRWLDVARYRRTKQNKIKAESHNTG